jgi:hypothetical protein
MCWVIDADITAYVDTIPHDRLMQTVAPRVVDGAMLAWVKRFLEAPVIDERDGGRPRRPRQGTPQGGVISPLLSNVYLHLLDRNFCRRVHRGDLQGRLVRDADDFVLLAPRRPDRALAWWHQRLARLGLTLHPEKTRVLDARQDAFVFLGHTHRCGSAMGRSMKRDGTPPQYACCARLAEPEEQRKLRRGSEFLATWRLSAGNQVQFSTGKWVPDGRQSKPTRCDRALPCPG